MRKLFLASFGAHDAGERLLKAALDTGVAPADILYLCPSPRKLRDVQVRFARTIKKDAFIPPRFQTLFELARDLHENNGTTRRFRSELKPLLVQSLLTRESPESKVRSKKTSVSTTPSIGYCRAVANFIRDVKLGAATDDLQAVRQTIAELLDPYEKPKVRALEALDILGRYDAALRSKGWSDDEDILALASGWAATGTPVRLLVLDSFVAPSRLEQQLIAALVERAETTLALCYGDAEDDPAYKLGSNFIRFLKGQSFSVAGLKPAPARPEPPLFRFNSPEDEVTGIARHIKQQNLNGQLDISKTVVAFPSLEEMAPLVARTFREYGLPATVYPAQDLAASPPVAAVLELLTAMESGYERVATTAAFASEFLPGLLRLSTDTTPEERALAARSLNRAARQAGIIKDADAWQHLAERLEPEYGFESDEEREFARDMEKRVRQAIGLVKEKIPETGTLGEHASALKELLGAASFCHNLKPDEPEAQPLLDDRGELYDMLDALGCFEADFGARPTDLTGFAKTVTYLIGLARRTLERMPMGLLVLSMPETLGLAPEHLYVGGLTESSLPSRYPVDPLLPDMVRRKLGLPDIDWHRDHERFHFERTRHSSPAAPWLSYHAAAEAKLVLPTPFLDLEPVTAEPAPGLFSPQEKQRYDGTTTGRTLPETALPVDFGHNKDVLAALSRRFGPQRKLSVTRLERYRACPYCFYVNEVMGLEPLEPPALEIEPQQWGIIVHRVLGRLYAKGAVPLASLKREALACLDHVVAGLGLTRFWAEVTRRLFENNIDDLIECEAELRSEGFDPADTEVSLSGPAGPDVLVKGRLDRYDSDGTRLRVLDYKTGGSPFVSAQEVTEDRTHLQLPIYCHLLKTVRPGKTIDNMGIYSTREARVRWLADNDCTVDELVRAALENAIEIVKAIRAGEFPPNPADEKACAECAQGFLCGRVEPAKGKD